MAESIRAVDANVVLRYLLDDVPDQAEKARGIVDSDDLVGLTAVALAEVAWTLTGPRYRFDRAIVVEHLVHLLARENIVTLGFDKSEAQAALLTCLPDQAAANVGDALIAACARSAGVLEIYSFDARFARAGLAPIIP